jgi:hypothetical protein
MAKKREVKNNNSDKKESRIKAFKNNFKTKFRENTITAITAAFGFLVALSWREPIQKIVDKIILRFNLLENEILILVTTALLVTLIAVLALIFLSRWESPK